MRAAVLASVLVASVLLLPVAQAGSLTNATAPTSRTVTVGNNDYEAFAVEIGTDWGLVVGVTSSDTIDVYVTSQQGYTDYVNPSAPSFEYIVALTQENVRTFNKTVTESGRKIIILDNDVVTSSGASPSGPVDVTLFLGRSQTSFFIGIVILLILVLLVVAAFVIRRRKRRAAMGPGMLPTPPAQPPMPPPPR